MFVFFLFQPHFLSMFVLVWNRGGKDKNDDVIAKSIQMFVCTSFSTWIAPNCLQLLTYFLAFLYTCDYQYLALRILLFLFPLLCLQFLIP